MVEYNLEELRAGELLQDRQAGAPYDAFNRPVRLRHAQLGTWWERILGVLSLIFVMATLASLVWRNL